MTAILLALAIFAGTQGPPAAPDREAHIVAMRARAQTHIEADTRRFSPAEVADIEARYRLAHADVGTPFLILKPDALPILEALVAAYPRSNRAGCAALTLALSAQADQRERRLRDVIANHSDAWCENGVQVGAQARALLAVHLAGLDRYNEAERIAVEMVRLFPGAIDESGATLDDLPQSIRLLRVPKIAQTDPEQDQAALR